MLRVGSNICEARMDIERVFRGFGKLARDGMVPGAQLAILHDGQCQTVEFGVAEHGTGQRITRDSKFPIGSVTKTFTATLALALVSDGDLELDEPIVGYLPELRTTLNGPGAGLTLRHLLSHTGGLASNPDEVRTTSMRRHISECCRKLDRLHRPGAGFSYSNLGYLLAGRLIEVVTGMNWWEAAEAVVFRPLGITPHFVIAPSDAPRAGWPIVTGHAVNPRRGLVRPIGQSLAMVDAPAGAVAASAADMIELARVHMTRERPCQPVSAPVLHEMRTPVARAEPFGLADGWGLGLAIYRNGDRTWFGHDGSGDGTACYLRINRDLGIAVALTTNGSTGSSVWQRLAGELDPGLPIGCHNDRTAMTRTITPSRELLGRYVNGETEYLVTAVDHGRMHLSVDDEPFAELFLYDGSVFAIRDFETGETNQTGRFLTDPRTDEPGWLQIGGRLARRRGRAATAA
jgi:CubicO group peptidase (beta-lactamase class C family)